MWYAFLIIYLWKMQSDQIIWTTIPSFSDVIYNVNRIFFLRSICFVGRLLGTLSVLRYDLTKWPFTSELSHMWNIFSLNTDGWRFENKFDEFSSERRVMKRFELIISVVQVDVKVKRNVNRSSEIWIWNSYISHCTLQGIYDTDESVWISE